ncbi:uncharacterized protein DNG_08074 [Cephalotrichum gorgonifer]|uniref:Uncharacterized protein n=1 Tax=Cephalotrichum gorgonifer TaxID=2041049 RepID=A0AAE8SYU0_9PEZI|nr:uncharacterized protein DNG_08074 [Cephalotrichum gorgonifer]
MHRTARMPRGPSFYGPIILQQHSTFSSLGPRTLGRVTPSFSAAHPPSSSTRETRNHESNSPSVIHGLYSDIHNIAVNRGRFIPPRLRSPLRKVVDDLRDGQFGGQDIKDGQVGAIIDFLKDINKKANLLHCMRASEAA